MLLTVARGLTNTEIANELHISLSTVKTHLASLMGQAGRQEPGRDRHVGPRNQAHRTTPQLVRPRPPPETVPEPPTCMGPRTHTSRRFTWMTPDVQPVKRNWIRVS